MLAKLQLRFAKLFFSSPAKKPKPRVRRVARKHNLKSEPELEIIWLKLYREFFPNNSNLLSYQIVWSKRPQKRTLASCNINYHRVVVARELNYPEYQDWLEPLIYHEMCHAVLGYSVAKNKHRRSWHGAEFKNLERQHPQMIAFDLWTKSGGWLTAVRSDRGKRSAAKRFSTQVK